MGEPAKSGRPRWILIGTGVLGLVAALLVVVARVYEVRKARAEAALAEAASAGADIGTPPPDPASVKRPDPEPSAAGSWDGTFRGGGKAVFILGQDGTATGSNGFTGRWSQSGRKVTVIGKGPRATDTPFKAEGEIDATGRTLELRMDIGGAISCVRQ